MHCLWQRREMILCKIGSCQRIEISVSWTETVADPANLIFHGRPAHDLCPFVDDWSLRDATCSSFAKLFGATSMGAWFVMAWDLINQAARDFGHCLSWISNHRRRNLSVSNFFHVWARVMSREFQTCKTSLLGVRLLSVTLRLFLYPRFVFCGAKRRETCILASRLTLRICTELSLTLRYVVLLTW